MKRSLYRKAKPGEIPPGTYEVTTTLVIPEPRVRTSKPPKGAKRKAKR